MGSAARIRASFPQCRLQGNCEQPPRNASKPCMCVYTYIQTYFVLFCSVLFNAIVFVPFYSNSDSKSNSKTKSMLFDCNIIIIIYIYIHTHMHVYFIHIRLRFRA